eukprot:6470613-Amphidinium_carterae.1
METALNNSTNNNSSKMYNHTNNGSSHQEISSMLSTRAGQEASSSHSAKTMATGKAPKSRPGKRRAIVKAPGSGHRAADESGSANLERLLSTMWLARHAAHCADTQVLPCFEVETMAEGL